MRSIRQQRPKRDSTRLNHPNSFQFNAAEGWLELGNPAEALLELDRLRAEYRLHPDVRFLRWRIFASCGHWGRCLAIARAMTERFPNDPRGWTALARTWRQKRNVRRAYATAISRIEYFPGWWPLFYDAACYAGALGKKDEATQLLRHAFALGPKKLLKQRARAERDLKGLVKR